MSAPTPIITPQARPAETRRDTVAAAVGGVFAACVGGYLTGWTAWAVNPDFTHMIPPMSFHVGAAFKSALDLIGGGYNGYSVLYFDAMSEAGFSVWWRVAALWAGAAAAGGGAFTLLNSKVDPIKHIRGRQLKTGKEALKEAQFETAQEIGKSAKGIELIRGSGVFISQDRETKHMVICGGTGSGKTVSVSHIATQAIARGDRILIIDYKGLTEKMPGDVIIADPTDQRGVLWNPADDIQTMYDAEEFARRTIPDGGKDPFWANSSRSVLAGLTTHCIKTKPNKWGFQDLAELMRQPVESYAKIMEESYPQALQFVANPDSNTTDSLIKNMSVTAGFIFQLAAAEAAAGDRPRISFREWIQNPNTKNRTIILKINDSFSQLSAAFNQAVIGVICGRVSSLPDVPPHKNRVWIVADEFPRLGKVIGWDQFLAVGRSKSLRIVTVLQSVSQLRQTFGEHETDTWTSIVGTMILGKNEGSTAKWYCDLIGEREVWTPSQNVSASAGGFTTSNGYGRERLPVLLPSQVSTDLGVRQNGCDSILYGLKNVHILKWRFLNKDDGWSTQRSDYEPAVWTLPANITTETAPVPTAIDTLDDELEHAKTTIALTSVLDWSVMEPLDVDVFTLKVDQQETEKQDDEAENEVANHSVEALAEHAIGDVAGGGLGIGLALAEELSGGSVGEVEQQIIPQKRTVSRRDLKKQKEKSRD